MSATTLADRATRLLVLAALLVALYAGLVWAAARPRFDFHRIVISGSLNHVSRAAIRAAVAGRLAGNFFTLALADSRATFESIPWVAQASVRRVWPDRLVVHLVERHAVGIWDDGRMLSDAGVLFDANADEAELDGPQIDFSGPPRLAADAARRLPEFRAALAAIHATPAQVEISERASWTIQTGGGLRIDLGRDEPAGSVTTRLAAIVGHYPTVVAQLGGPPARIDARYENGFAAAGP